MTQPMLPQPPQSADANDAFPLQTYAIVDCAHLDGLFFLETEKDPNIVSRSLLAGTIHEASAIAGPLLIQVAPPDNANLARTLLSIEAENSALIWLWSASAFDELHPRLQMLQFGERRDGQGIFLRYFDPRLLKAMFAIFRDNKEARQTLALIRGWAYRLGGQRHYLA